MEKSSSLNISFIQFFVQSSKFDPDYCEAKINEFLLIKMLEYAKDCSESVDNNIKSIVNHLGQNSQNLKDRATYDQMQLTR